MFSHPLCTSLDPSSRSFLNAKWRTKEGLVGWKRYTAALDLREECERDWCTAEVGVRENIQIRLEYLIVALQQVLPFVSINSAVLNELLGNICLLHGRWIRLNSLNCTSLAVRLVDINSYMIHVYSLTLSIMVNRVGSQTLAADTRRRAA